ncbi:D-glucuronate isomerase [Arachidicoccus rhizosphaerae]|uniref:Uronate isomerase n=1 Tax=Arachidicoccus rhizosphaerae TaxID=551991 RepID=A0A1H4AXS9_9BACT|nr:glucuronate isomerase [Arachidicoccus rhizosphaerae]SEA40665.1 D-glucuronate isomerase [Arachidicoccus rhizosphaerae]
MRPFLDKDFLLESETAKKLYHEAAENMPIIDYHCHLSPQQIAEDHQFNDITEAWLGGDHYKWRAMRANGIDESYMTGNKPSKEKFLKWAKTVPYTMRNPLYHWTHLELQRYFGITELLSEKTADAIYEKASAMLRTPQFSVKNLLRKMGVKTVCTTDDPTDDLKWHQQLKDDGFEIPVLPAFRPDKAMAPEDPAAFNQFVALLEKATGHQISSYEDYLTQLKNRHDFFATMGCSVSDHGLEEIYAEDFTNEEIEIVFNELRKGNTISLSQNRKFKSALLLKFAQWDHQKGWVQQFHLGALRNNNTRLLQQMGADVGCDSIGDFKQAVALSKFLRTLDDSNQLTKTIIYNLNPADNEIFATMAGNFNDGRTIGKIQFGAAWWFLDQKTGMISQMNALSNMGLLSRFVGMLTDSRSFLSYPRHEYFRRILCNLFGHEVENGELPAQELDWIQQVIKDICFNNAARYFGWPQLLDSK